MMPVRAASERQGRTRPGPATNSLGRAADPEDRMIRKQDAIEYHSMGRKGKIEVCATKPLLTQRDLSLAYTPGVAEPCLEIEKDPSLAFQYTARGNLVAVISNGTAVLGLGNIGALAGKPVMEGKGVLFKKFADIDVFDIEIESADSDEIINIVSKLEPTFGGINLEDIKAPECFYIEERLKEIMGIPVFHDDQHGTAIISGAALLNASEIVGKPLESLRVVVSGAGASAIACAKFYELLGCKRENMMLVDTKGVVFEGRTEGMNKYKAYFAGPWKQRTLAEAMVGADMFLGCSVAGLVTKEMVRSMADRPIVFAMANPDPEISYPEAKAAREDVIIATGRSDFPNQVNNVLGFPFIFRGALDVQARVINEEMKVAASRALAGLAKQDVPESVKAAYGGVDLKFGPDYIIPKPFDPRVLTWEAPAVAEAAMRTGVARKQIDMGEYRASLERIYGRTHMVMRKYREQARRQPKRVVLPESDDTKILRACQILADEGLARPVLLGDEAVLGAKIRELGLDVLGRVEIIDHLKHPRFDEYAREYSRLRQRRGVTLREANYRLHSRKYFAMMMLRMGDIDAVVLGMTTHYSESLRPALEVVGTREGVKRVAGMYMIVLKNELAFFADCTVNISPSAEEVADIAIVTADEVRELGVEPRIAMISFSNFGSTKHPESEKMARATEIVHARRPDLEVDGEMQFNTATDYALMQELFPFCRLKGPANTFIFANLDAANSAYKMMANLGGAEVVGPILMGLKKPVEVLQRADSVDSVVRLVSIAAVEAQGGLKRWG
jgi:malate dehydrogenase (oxaloacetate-decarboxylating)(NADP+)